MRRLFVFAKFLVIAIGVTAVLRLVMGHNAEQTRILVVHSYNTDLAWVNDVDDGIRRAVNGLEGRAASSLNLRTHYMNLRNHPNCNFYKNAATEVRFTIDDWRPAQVILVDDLAQALVGFNQLRLSPEADRDALATDMTAWLAGDRCDLPEPSYFDLHNPQVVQDIEVIFAGVNGSISPYGYDQASNVSGIYEKKNYGALVETLVALAAAYPGEVAGIQMLNDASPTGLTENTNYLAADWSPFATSPPVAARTLSKWEATVRAANEQNLMLLIANYQNVVDSDGAIVAPDALIAWTERTAKLPVLGANTRFVADGGMMTVAIAGSEQGETAMKLALALLDGDDTRPQVQAKQFLIGMNQSLIRKRDLELPTIYEAFSREIGSFVDSLEQVFVVQNAGEQ